MGVGIQSLGTRGFVPKGLFGRILHHRAFLEGSCTNRSVHQGILHDRTRQAALVRGGVAQGQSLVT